jgi:two-component system, NarL family, nitrate/nitrite response regulator NarL
MGDRDPCMFARDLPCVLIVSDVMLFRQGLRARLGQIGSLHILDSVAPDAAPAFLKEHTVDVVLLDVSRRRAISHASALRVVQPDIRIVAFGIGGHQDALAGAEAGVNAFVGENGDVTDICDAIKMVVRGESYCTPRLTAVLIDHIATMARSAPAMPQVRLTTREREIAAMVGDGKSNKEIAGALHISPATVKNHVHHILEKLELPGRSAIGGRLGEWVGADCA